MQWHLMMTSVPAESLLLTRGTVIDLIRHGDDVEITVRNATNDLAVVLVG